MPATYQANGNMLHQKRNGDVPAASSSSASKRPRSFYSSNIRTWASRHSDDSGIQAGVEKSKAVKDSLRQSEGDGDRSVNDLSVVIDCETVSEKSSTCAEKCASTSSENAAICDVVISDSDDDDSGDFQRVESRQKAVKAKPNPRSKSAKHCSKVRSKKTLPRRAKAASKTAAVRRKSLSPVDLCLEVESDDGDEDSSVGVSPSSKSLNNNVDIVSCQPSANRSLPVSSPIIEIDSDSCSSVRDSAPSQTKSFSSVRDSTSVLTKSFSSVKDSNPLLTKSLTSVRSSAPLVTKSSSSARDSTVSLSKSFSKARDDAPLLPSALPNHSASLNIENQHFNNISVPSLPTPSLRNPCTGEGIFRFPKMPAAPVQQYSNYQGAFQSYCGNKTGSFTMPHLSNGGVEPSMSGNSLTNGAIGAEGMSQEQLLAFVKSGKFSLQYIAGVPVLCPINVAPVNFITLPFEGGGLQPSMKTIGSIYGPSLQTNTVGYGADRWTVPGSGFTNSSANAVSIRAQVGIRAQQPAMSLMDWRSPIGSQPSSFGARNGGGQTAPRVRKTLTIKSNPDVGSSNKTKFSPSRRRSKSSKDSPVGMAKSKATTADLGVDKDKDLSDKTKRDKDRTDEDSMNRPKTAEKVKKEGERPVAKALMGLALQLVSKQVIFGLIKVTKKTLEKKPEEQRILTKLQNRHAELMCETEAFELKTKECACKRFKTESSNIMLEHLQRGSSAKIYRCCFCFSITIRWRTFSQHMARIHKVRGCQKHYVPKTFSCSLCSYETNLRPMFELHSKRCGILLQTNKNLHPGLDDFDIPILYEERKQRQTAKELSLVANTGSKIDQWGQRSFNFGILCHTCGKSFSRLNVLRRHRNSAHRIADPKSGGTPLKKTTPSKVPDPKSSGTPLKKIAPSKIPDPKSEGTPLKKTPSKIPGSRTPSEALSTDVDPQSASDTKVKCCLCDEILGREMVQHFRVQHHISLNTMVKKHFCYFCDCSLGNFKCFEEHMVTIHRSIFPDKKTLWNRIFACARFRERDALIMYNASENDGVAITQPWQCLQCKKRFLSSSFCYRHAMLFHSTPKVECQLCPKMVATGATYTQHVQQCHIRKCCVMLERLALPYVTPTPPETKAAQPSFLPEQFDNCGNEMDVALSENEVSSLTIKSPSITSCDQDFPILDERDSMLTSATVSV